MAFVQFQELLEAFEFVSAAPPGEHTVYVCVDTGRIYYVSSELGPLDEDAPEDLEESDRYLGVPHRNDFGLGRRLALQFADEHLPEHYGEVTAYFRKKGAYSKFKQLLDEQGTLEKWYAFEAAATTEALRQWCDEAGIRLNDDPDQSPSGAGFGDLQKGNLFADCAPPAAGERADVLLALRNLLVERIVSSAKLTSRRYVQAQDEWVALLSGEAKLEVEGKVVDLKAGDYIFLPSGVPHTVQSASEGAVWLAVHLHTGAGPE